MKIPFWRKAFQYFRALTKYMAGPPLEWTALSESRDAIVKELIKTFNMQHNILRMTHFSI